MRRIPPIALSCIDQTRSSWGPTLIFRSGSDEHSDRLRGSGHRISAEDFHGTAKREFFSASFPLRSGIY